MSIEIGRLDQDNDYGVIATDSIELIYEKISATRRKGEICTVLMILSSIES